MRGESKGGTKYFQRLTTLLKNKCSYETKKYLKNSDFQGGNRRLGNCRREASVSTAEDADSLYAFESRGTVKRG